MCQPAAAGTISIAGIRGKSLETIESRMARIKSALYGIRSPAAPGEYDLHKLIADALTLAGLEAHHEYKLGARCRIDFIVDDIGIEVKKGRPTPSLLRKQLARYLEYDAIHGAIIVTQQSVLLPERILGKPIVCLSLNKLWGVALP